MSDHAAASSSFGYFQNDGTEFVVTDPHTPRPWMNYSWNPWFIAGVNQFGTGEGAYKERPLQYIDERGRNLIARDQQRCFFLRDNADGDFFSPGWHPAHAPLQQFACTHGLGYSVLDAARGGIGVNLRWFVPRNAPCEIWTVTVTNCREQSADLTWFSFVNLLLGGYAMYCDYFSSLSGEFDPETGTVVGMNTSPDCPHPWFNAFLGADRPADGFDTSVRAFLGPYGYVNRPQAVLNGRCAGSLAANEKLAAATEHRLQVPAGESIRFNVFIGACKDLAGACETVSSLSAGDTVDSEFADLKDRKARMVQRLNIATPDAKMNYLVNGWLKQQVQIYADVGSDNGRGFRDAMQLLWATASFDLDYTRSMLEECLQHQYADGHTLRGWLPVDDHHYSDGPVWIPPVLDAYIKESGESSILQRTVPFFDSGQATVWEHALRGLRHSCADLGPHGLVRCRFGDWNDSLTGIDLDGQGESVWTSIGIVYGLKTAAEIARRVVCDQAVADELLARAQTLTEAVLTHGWDGQWFLRAINDLGEPVGSYTNTEGRIWLLPQVWAVLAGIVDSDQAANLFAQLDRHLATPYGYKTLHPPYTTSQPRVGRVADIAPGMWENGTPYCHANGFKILADCVAGRGNAAYETYCQVMPDTPRNPSTHSGCEPYVFTNQYIGPDNRRAGETQFAWMTGSGGWFFRAVTEGMLGVRADYPGLLIDPCLPQTWTECRLTRDFRAARYHITIRNPHGVQKAPVTLTVDGKPVDGAHAPVFADGAEHIVEAVMQPSD